MFKDFADTAIGLPPDTKRDWFAYQTIWQDDKEKLREVEQAGFLELRSSNLPRRFLDIEPMCEYGLPDAQFLGYIVGLLDDVATAKTVASDTRFQAASYYYYFYQNVQEYECKPVEACKFGITMELLKESLRLENNKNPHSHYELQVDHDYVRSIITSAEPRTCKECNKTFPGFFTKNEANDKSEISDFASQNLRIEETESTKISSYVGDGIIRSGYGMTREVILVIKDSHKHNYKDYDHICDECVKSMYDNGLLHGLWKRCGMYVT